MPTLIPDILRVDERIAELLDGRAMPAGLRSAMRYAALGPGKRVRPVLVMRWSELACDLTPHAPSHARDASLDLTLDAAAAIEMVHAFSLVHDDLPAMDDDDLRRGRPTLHRHTNEAMAILAGDALLSLSHEVLARHSGTSSLLQELSSATTDMIAGQVRDTLPEAVDEPGLEPLEQLRRIHHEKTGALLRCACRMGVWCGGGGEAIMTDATRYADAVGVMFQAIDDLLDVTSNAATLGKATQKDADAGKLTYPGLLGVEGTRRHVAQLLEQAEQALAPYGPSAHALRTFAQGLAQRDR